MKKFNPEDESKMLEGFAQEAEADTLRQAQKQDTIEYGNNLQPTRMPMVKIQKLLKEFDMAQKNMFFPDDGTGFARPNSQNIDRVNKIEKILQQSGYSYEELAKIMKNILGGQ